MITKTLLSFLLIGNLYTTFYSDYFNGKRTASGKIFYNNSSYCAIKNIPFGTKLLVKYKNKSVIVTVEDRPLHDTLDLSKRSFSELTDLSVGKIITKVYIVNNKKSNFYKETLIQVTTRNF